MTFDNTLHCLLAATDIPSVKMLTSYAFSCLADHMYGLPWKASCPNDDLAHVLQFTQVTFCMCSAIYSSFM